MNKKWLSLIILFLCLSLAGIIIVQYLWIKNALAIREAQFNQRVNDALGNAVTRLETNENMALLSSRLISDSIRNLIQDYAKDTLSLAQSQIDSKLLNDALDGFLVQFMAENPYRAGAEARIKEAERSYRQYEEMLRRQGLLQRHQSSVDALVDQLQANVILANDWVNIQFEWEATQLERLDSVWVIQEQYIRQGEGKVRRDVRQIPLHREQASSPPPGRVFAVPPPPPAPPQAINASKILEDKIRKLDKRASQLQNLIQRMAVEFEDIPLKVESRIDKNLLESTLKSCLLDKDVKLPFEFAVFTSLNDSNPIPIRSAGYSESHPAKDHLVSLFPHDVIEKPYQLQVYFPGQKSHILKSLSVLMGGSVLFTLIIVISSVLSIFVIVRQKKISDIKTDFINNMTHEFKTPIATISIAADSINNDKVIVSPETIKSYTRIIKEENSRMNTRVEQVLQMSLLDSRDFKLHLTLIDLQDLIRHTLDHFRLIVEKRGGHIEAGLNATNTQVLADEGHMRNVLMNLLDNANKYSVSRPEIIVTTGNKSGYFFFSVEDKGIGMSQEVQKKVFDKFFRVTTGNVHNIKGFGLGLSYVKAIVLAHHGEIQLASEPGSGSRFQISIPLTTMNKL